jgi:hypothetical protein
VALKVSVSYLLFYCTRIIVFVNQKTFGLAEPQPSSVAPAAVGLAEIADQDRPIPYPKAGQESTQADTQRVEGRWAKHRTKILVDLLQLNREKTNST